MVTMKIRFLGDMSTRESDRVRVRELFSAIDPNSLDIFERKSQEFGPMDQIIVRLMATTRDRILPSLMRLQAEIKISVEHGFAYDHGFGM
jgi:hypothetical protein